MNYTLNELEKFKKMFIEIYDNNESEIKNIAVKKWNERNIISTPDCFLYAIQLKINELIHEEYEKKRLKVDENGD